MQATSGKAKMIKLINAKGEHYKVKTIKTERYQNLMNLPGVYITVCERGQKFNVRRNKKYDSKNVWLFNKEF